MRDEMNDSDKLLFLEEEPSTGVEPVTYGYWKVLIVDDEEAVHQVTKMVLGDVVFDGKGLEFISAYSGEEAKRAIVSSPDTAVILLDVVMERESSGLEVVKYVREVLGNDFVRIVLRTGQPGIAPAEKVIMDYDINDYAEKADLTAQKLFAIMISSLRSYRNIAAVASVSERLQRESAERLQAEKAFRETQHQLQAIMDNSPAVIYVKDVQGRYLIINREFERLFHIGRGEVVGMEDADIFPPDTAAVFRENDILVLSTGEALEREEMVPLEDGLHTYLSIKYPICDADGAPSALCGISTDITAWKRAEESRRQSDESYRLLVRNIPGVVYRGYADGTVEFFDDKIQALTGYPSEDFASRKVKWVDLIHPEDMAAAKTIFIRALRGEREYVREYRVGRRDGEYGWIQERSQIVCREDGRIDYISGVLFDVTEHRRAQEDKEKLEAQFRQAQKMEAVGRLAGGVAHDFNNMLNVILGYTEMSLVRLEPADRIYTYLKAVQEAAGRSADLTRQLLAFSRRQTIAPRAVDLNEQTKGMERLLARIIGEDIDLMFRLSADLWPVYMDPAQIDQIVANLSVNSRDAMPEGGKLTVETANIVFDLGYCEKHLGFRPGDFVMLAVSDTGCGMDEEILEHVFEPFFTTKPEGRGTGLGLATVYGIVKQNNGFMNIYSEPGHGTAVKIYIPRYVGREAASSAVAEESTPAGGRETVLLVEDEREVRRLARTILEELGYRVLEASGPREAIALCQGHPGRIHLLLTDVVMPDMNGKELEGRIRVMKPGVKTLFMSGYTANAIAHRGVLEKSARFLQKPFSIDTMARKVREVLDAAF